MKRIVVIGSSNTDMVVKASHLPAAGETVLGGEFMMNAGGKGANQAVAAAHYGGRVSFVARVGDDMFGRVNAEGENSIVVASGANMALGREDIDRAAEEIRAADVVLMQLEVPVAVVEYAAEIAAEAGVPVILNPAPAPAEALRPELLRHLYAITPNRSEAARISGIEVTDMAGARRAAEAIHAMGVRNVVITLGGDSAAAAISVTRMGAQTAAPTRKEVKEFLVNRE